MGPALAYSLLTIRYSRLQRSGRLRIIFMGTPEFAVPTLTEIVSSGHEVVAVYTRAPKPAGRGQAERKSPVHVAAEGFGIPVLHAANRCKRRGRADRLCRARCRCGGGRRLWADPAQADPRRAAARLPQPPRLAAAALARCGADPARGDGRRRAHRRHGDADGRGARYRPRRAGRRDADRPRHDDR